MYILSQDKSRIVNTAVITEIQISSYGGNEISCDGVRIGTYESKAAAQEVLLQIFEALELEDDTFEMPTGNDTVYYPESF